MKNCFRNRLEWVILFLSLLFYGLQVFVLGKKILSRCAACNHTKNNFCIVLTHDKKVFYLSANVADIFKVFNIKFLNKLTLWVELLRLSHLDSAILKQNLSTLVSRLLSTKKIKVQVTEWQTNFLAALFFLSSTLRWLCWGLQASDATKN